MGQRSGQGSMEVRGKSRFVRQYDYEHTYIQYTWTIIYVLRHSDDSHNVIVRQLRQLTSGVPQYWWRCNGPSQVLLKGTATILKVQDTGYHMVHLEGYCCTFVDLDIPDICQKLWTFKSFGFGWVSISVVLPKAITYWAHLPRYRLHGNDSISMMIYDMISLSLTIWA